MSNELQPRNFDVVALHELCWKGEKVWKSRRTDASFYQSYGTTNKMEPARGKMQNRVIGWQPINELMCKLRIKGRFFNYSIINVQHARKDPTTRKKHSTRSLSRCTTAVRGEM